AQETILLATLYDVPSLDEYVSILRLILNGQFVDGGSFMDDQDFLLKSFLKRQDIGIWQQLGPLYEKDREILVRIRSRNALNRWRGARRRNVWDRNNLTSATILVSIDAAIGPVIQVIHIDNACNAGNQATQTNQNKQPDVVFHYFPLVWIKDEFWIGAEIDNCANGMAARSHLDLFCFHRIRTRGLLVNMTRADLAFDFADCLELAFRLPSSPATWALPYAYSFDAARCHLHPCRDFRPSMCSSGRIAECIPGLAWAVRRAWDQRWLPAAAHPVDSETD